MRRSEIRAGQVWHHRNYCRQQYLAISREQAIQLYEWGIQREDTNMPLDPNTYDEHGTMFCVEIPSTAPLRISVRTTDSDDEDCALSTLRDLGEDRRRMLMQLLHRLERANLVFPWPFGAEGLVTLNEALLNDRKQKARGIGDCRPADDLMEVKVNPDAPGDTKAHSARQANELEVLALGNKMVGVITLLDRLGWDTPEMEKRVKEAFPVLKELSERHVRWKTR